MSNSARTRTRPASEGQESGCSELSYAMLAREEGEDEKVDTEMRASGMLDMCGGAAHILQGLST